MATLSQTVTAFQAINASIAGVQSAPTPANYPPTLLGTKLPYAITLPGPGRIYPQGLGGGRRTQRTYVLHFYVAKADPNVAGPYAQTLDLMQDVIDVYRDPANFIGELILSGGATVVFNSTDGLGDLGFLTTLPYGGDSYYGFTLHVPVLETG